MSTKKAKTAKFAKSPRPAKTITLKLQRLIKAPPEKVFAAWTTPAGVAQWFGPETCRVTAAKINLRAGGKYQFQIHAGEMGELHLSGVYREVKSPARLVYTWTWQSSPGMDATETLVTVDFVNKNGDTAVQLTHAGLPNAEILGQHNHGWNGSLDKLEKLHAAGQPPRPPGSFVWNELVTNDEAGSSKFYTTLFGWQAAPMATGPMPYTVFNSNGQPAGGMLKIQNPQAPPHWLAYVLVENVDATLKHVAAIGGKVIVPGCDVPTVGRVAVLQDPQGAFLGIMNPPRS